jgi:hypothetical protein
LVGVVSENLAQDFFNAWREIMKNVTIILVTVLFMFGTVGELQAIPRIWGVWDWEITEPVHILVSPSGNGTPLTNADVLAGPEIDATIRIQLWVDDSDTGGDPNPHFVPNFPAEDIWLEIPGQNVCIGRAHPDGPTDSEGWFTFSGSPGMGGWKDPTEGPPYVYVVVSGNILYDDFGQLISPTIVVNSPDINADLTVNLTDVAIFSVDYHGNYSFGSDFFWDGVINLSDVPFMVVLMGDTCPEP